MGKKPTSVLVLSIIGIVWASINILGSCATPAAIALQWNSSNPMSRVYHDTGVLVVTIIATLISLLLEVFLLFVSIAALRLRPWARMGMIVYGALYIGITIIMLLVNFLYVTPRTNAVIATSPPVAGGIDVGAFMLATQIFTVCFVVLTFLYPICIFYFFTRPKVVNAFNGIFDAEPTNFPVDYAPYPPHDPPQNPPAA